MKGFLCLALLFGCFTQVYSQKKCETVQHFKDELNANPAAEKNYKAIEEFTRQYINSQNNGEQARTTVPAVIRIPVVVHVLYHDPEYKISDDLIRSQIDVLNKDYRRRNADTSLTPAVFRNIATDCEIEFHLATSDPRQFSTTGIVKKYTPVQAWTKESYKMMSDAEYGSSAWDTKSYLNIWVCNLSGAVAGYSTLPGSDVKTDGVVIDFSAFGITGHHTGYDYGRTVVHEVGHWLNLIHIWGDSNCGDDGVSDTPPQADYTVGCPTGIRSSCNNGSAGNMYMNFMDFTDDACMNMFTKGQKQRMRSIFAAGGARESILSSKGLNPPLFISGAIELPDPKWLFVKIYPNPASNKLLINMDYDPRWIGKTINITNLSGQTVMRVVITSKRMEVNISWLQAGTYILSAKKEDGETVREKFFKM
jgi:Pregnancy-associated plasma protein-A/Secretion system C-terminal sorting domain